MMTDWHWYAADRVNEFILMFKDGLRNLDNPVLDPYYSDMDTVPSAEINERYSASEEFRSGEDLPPVGTESFASQISSVNGQVTFQRLVIEMGIEKVYTEDISFENSSVSFPGLDGFGDIFASLEMKGFVPDFEAVKDRFPEMALPLDEGNIDHVNEPFPSVWAEEDSTVAQRMRKARQYVIDYIGLED
jgi:hypothetical protein